MVNALILSIFKVYERGVELFTYPVAFELWNIYLTKFTQRYVIRILFMSSSLSDLGFIGWIQNRAYSRFVRAGIRTLSTQILQATVCHVRPIGGGIWSRKKSYERI